MRQAIVVAVVLCVVGATHAQNMQIGTKTTEQMIVAYSAQASPTATFVNDIAPAFGKLWDAALAEGLQPLGLSVVVMDMTGLEAGTVQWEAWLPLVTELDPAGLGAMIAPTVKCVAPTKVAYTYRAGNPERLMEDFERLSTYLAGQGLVPSGKARTIAYIAPRPENNLVLEAQLEVAE